MQLFLSCGCPVVPEGHLCKFTRWCCSGWQRCLTHLDLPGLVSKEPSSCMGAQQTEEGEIHICRFGFSLLCFRFLLNTTILCSLLQAGDGKRECRMHSYKIVCPLGNRGTPGINQRFGKKATLWAGQRE